MLGQYFVSLLVTVFAAQRVAAVIPVGGLCAGFAGPANDTCIEGSTCCNVSPDRSLCTIVPYGEDCAQKYIEEGGLCSGIAGPSPLHCIAGTTCCQISPDNAQCLPRCRGRT